MKGNIRYKEKTKTVGLQWYIYLTLNINGQTPPKRRRFLKGQQLNTIQEPFKW